MEESIDDIYFNHISVPGLINASNPITNQKYEDIEGPEDKIDQQEAEQRIMRRENLQKKFKSKKGLFSSLPQYLGIFDKEINQKMLQME